MQNLTREIYVNTVEEKLGHIFLQNWIHSSLNTIIIFMKLVFGTGEK